MGGAAGHELTPREAAVLAAVERRLTNAEIAAELFISLRTVESHIAALRRKLDVDTRVGLIDAAWRRRGSSVPVPANSFVGRDDDLSAVRGLLATHRFVSVVGVGGCGKTRLALEVAASDARVPIVAELEHASSADVVATVARAVGIGPDAGADPVAALGLALEGQRYLLVLDNCDLVTGAVATLVRSLLALAPALSVLATSRSPVGGDVVHLLMPLPVDQPDCAAVRLFLERVGPGLSDDDKGLATRICRRLDGLPLAIELAAARARHLPLAELAELLDAGLGSLDQAGPAGRHRTLHTAFAWTWDLLEDDEQVGLARVAALPDAFDLATAGAVGVPDGVVLRLLDRSLLVAAGSVPGVGSPGPQRFRLLAPMRAFVLDRTDFALPHEVRALHGRYVAGQLGALRARARTDDSAEAVAAWRRLSGDACTALGWALQRHDPLAVELAAGVSVMVQQHGADRRSLDLLAHAVKETWLPADGDVATLFEIGMALGYGDLTAMDLVARELLARRSEDDHARMLAHELAGFTDGYLDRAEAALAHLAIAEELAERLGETWHLGSTRQARGIVLRRRPETVPLAVAAFETSMAAYVRAGDAAHVNNVRYMVASVLAILGERTDHARALAVECLDYARENGNRHELAHAQLTRAMLDGPGADDDLAEARDSFRAVGDLRCLTRSNLLLADRRALPERLVLLEQALDVALAAGDRGHQATALERLAAARWEAGAHRSAAVTVGNLARLVGHEEALERIAELRDELAPWATAVAEGEARGPQPVA